MSTMLLIAAHRRVRDRRSALAVGLALLVTACGGNTNGAGSTPTLPERLLGNHGDGSFAQLVEIETATGAPRRLTGAGILGCDEIRALAWNDELQMLFGFDRVLHELVWIDLETGNVDLLGPSLRYDIRDLAVRNGVLYGVDLSARTVVRFDASYQARPLPPHGFQGIESLAYDAANDWLYGCDNQTDSLIKLNPVNGSGVVVGPLGIASTPNILSMFDDPTTGAIYAADDQGVWRVDTATGQATAAGSLQEEFFGVTAVPGNRFVASESNNVGTNGKSLLTFEIPAFAAARGPSLGIDRTGTIVPLPGGQSAYCVDTIQRATRVIDLASGRSTYVGPSVFTPETLGLSYENDAILGLTSKDLAVLDTQSGLFLPTVAHELLALTGVSIPSDMCRGLEPGRIYVTCGTWLAEINIDDAEIVDAFDFGFSGIRGIDREPGTQRLRGLDTSGLSYLIDPKGHTVTESTRFFPTSMRVTQLSRELGTSNWLGIDVNTNQLVRRVKNGRVESVGCFGLGTIDGLATDVANDVVYALTCIGSDRSLVRITSGLETEVVGLGKTVVVPANVVDMAYVPARGRLYGVTQTLTRVLYEIDPTTGVATALGNLARSVVVGETDGMLLYGIDTGTDELVTIDIDTRVITTVGPIGFSSIFGLARSQESGALFTYDAATISVVRIDPTTGVGTKLSDARFNTHALTYLPW